MLLVSYQLYLILIHVVLQSFFVFIQPIMIVNYKVDFQVRCIGVEVYYFIHKFFGFNFNIL
jgi:hypothetical protein